jgi:hypothetical protein
MAAFMSASIRDLRSVAVLMSNQAMGMACAKYLKTTQNGADAA